MAGRSYLEDPVIVPVKLEKKFKNALVDHCRKEGLMLSALMRKLIKEYAEKEGIETNG